MMYVFCGICGVMIIQLWMLHRDLVRKASFPIAAAPKKTYDTLTLFLVSADNTLRSEISLHCEKAPDHYEYAGKTYQRSRKTHAHGLRYDEVAE